MIHLDDYGAVGDGVTNDRTAFLNAVAAARANDDILVGDPDKTYLLGDDPGGANPAYDFNTAGRYRWRDLNLKAPDAFATRRFIKFTGPYATGAINLQSDIAVGDETAVLSSIPSWSSGDLLMVYSDADYHPARAVNSSANGKKSLYVRLKSIAVDTPAAGQATLTFDTPSPRSFSTSDTGRIARQDETVSVELDRVHMIHEGADTNNSTALSFFDCTASIIDSGVDGFRKIAFELQRCHAVNVQDVYAYNISMDGHGYGVTMGGCWRPTVRGVRARNLRHAVALGASGGISGFAYFLGQGGECSDVIAEELLDSLLDSHSGHVGFVWSNACGQATSGTEGGIVLQGAFQTVSGLEMTSGGTATGTSGSTVFALIQNFGTPADEGPNTYHLFGLNSLGGSYDNLLAVQGFDPQDFSDVHVSVNGLTGISREHAITASSTSAANRGGGISLHLSGLSVQAGLTGIYAQSRKDRTKVRVFASGEVSSISDSSGAYALYAYADGTAESAMPQATITLGQTSVGNPVEVTLDADYFKPDMAGDFITEVTGSGKATILTVKSARSATVDITTAFTSANASDEIAANGWTVDADLAADSTSKPAQIFFTSGTLYRQWVASGHLYRETRGKVAINADQSVIIGGVDTKAP